MFTLGLDLGDKQTRIAVLNTEGEPLEECAIQTSPEAFTRFFERFKGSVAALEVGPHSRWASQLLIDLGLRVYVANPRQLGLIYGSKDKDDRLDAERLARLARVDSKLLHPIIHRARDKQVDLQVVKARQLLVDTRTKLVNHVRGILKSYGLKMKKCTTSTFASQVKEIIPEELMPALEPVLEILEGLRVQIRSQDKAIEALVADKYQIECDALQQVDGVGPVTALTFVLTIDDPYRFKKSRDVGSYLGLRPRRSESGDSSPQLSISKAGDKRLRMLMVQCAHYILGPFGKESDLRVWGLRKAEVGGRRGKRRAVVAVARKLSVLMHRLWVTGEVYEPLRNTNKVKPLAPLVAKPSSSDI